MGGDEGDARWQQSPTTFDRQAAAGYSHIWLLGPCPFFFFFLAL